MVTEGIVMPLGDGTAWAGLGMVWSKVQNGTTASGHHCALEEQMGKSV